MIFRLSLFFRHLTTADYCKIMTPVLVVRKTQAFGYTTKYNCVDYICLIPPKQLVKFLLLIYSIVMIMYNNINLLHGLLSTDKICPLVLLI